MARAFLFADEAGCFSFRRGPQASRYFILCSISIDSCDIGARLLALRRDMVWRRAKLNDHFHATEDTQDVRNEVFALLGNEKFIIDATILEKSKAQPQIRLTKERFYKHAWFYHFKYISKSWAGATSELMITAASVGTNKGQKAFTEAVTDVVKQTVPIAWRAAFWQAKTDPCLQIADYCAWAIQRKWEKGDSRSYALIRSKIRSEYDLWSPGTTHYY